MLTVEHWWSYGHWGDAELDDMLADLGRSGRPRARIRHVIVTSARGRAAPPGGLPTPVSALPMQQFTLSRG